MSNVAVIEPRPSIVAGARPMAIVPTNMDDAYRLAKAVCLSGLAPKGLDKPEACMVAILHGLEIGLNPMTALQRIAVVNGRPTLWGDGAMALVRASGLCEYVHEMVGGEAMARTATCAVLRRGEPEPIVRRFSADDAKKAGLWGKAGPWTQYPDRMLQMRARAFALRDGFADVLGGLYLKEEIDDRDPLPAAPPSQPIAHAPQQIEHDDGLFDEARMAAKEGSYALAVWRGKRTGTEDRRLVAINDELDATAAHADAETPEREGA
jgi:hypothetical protein